MATSRILRLKAAQNQLIALCGGIDDCAEIGIFGRSTVGRWNDLGDPTLMPLNAVMTLEAHCGQPLVTAALAEIAGRRLAEPDGETGSQVKIMSRHAEAIVQAGELMATGAAAFADGRVTPAEARQIDRAAGLLELALTAYRKALAGVIADGGLKVVG